jgi:hypothetical protein
MEPLTVFYEDRPDVMASLPLAAFRTQPNQETKIRLIRVAGRLTDESLAALYQTSRAYSAASFSIVDFSAVTEFAVSSRFIRYLAEQKAAMADTLNVPYFIAPQPHVFGLCRMFQYLRDGKLPLLQIVHTLDEAFASMGIQPPHFEPSVLPIPFTA